MYTIYWNVSCRFMDMQKKILRHLNYNNFAESGSKTKKKTMIQIQIVHTCQQRVTREAFLYQL